MIVKIYWRQNVMRPTLEINHVHPNGLDVKTAPTWLQVTTDDGVVTHRIPEEVIADVEIVSMSDEG